MVTDRVSAAATTRIAGGPADGAQSQVVETTTATLGSLGYLKRDGDIMFGFEMVTHPMTYPYALQHFPWQLLPELANRGCYTDHTVGIHIHISRAAFTRIHAYKWLKFIYRNKTELVALARRSSFSARFCPDTRRRIRHIVHGNRCPLGRNQAVNTYPRDTFELRVFSSSLDPNQVKAAIGFAHASVEYTRDLTTADLARNDGWAWHSFRDWLTQHDHYAPLLAEIVTNTQQPKMA